MIKKERIDEWVKNSQQVSSVENQGEKEAFFLVEKQKMKATLAVATSEEEFEERLRVQDEETSSSSNYLQSNEDDCYEILDWLT